MNNIWPGRFARLRSQRRLPSAQTAPNHLHKNRSLRQQKPRAARCGSMGNRKPIPHRRAGHEIYKIISLLSIQSARKRSDSGRAPIARAPAPALPRRLCGPRHKPPASDAGRPSPCRLFLGAGFPPTSADQSNKISIPLDFMKRSSFRLALTSIWRTRSRVTP